MRLGSDASPKRLKSWPRVEPSAEYTPERCGRNHSTGGYGNKVRASNDSAETETATKGLDDAHDVTLGIGEEANLNLVHHLLRAHHSRPAEALGLRQRSLYIGHHCRRGGACSLHPS